jgi:predicted TIM-barrel fold metal-dependent hydrolase
LGGAMLFINNGRVMGNLILSGLLDRYSKLKLVSVESGIGRVPFLLEAIDYEYQEVAINQAKQQRKPSEYFKTNF